MKYPRAKMHSEGRNDNVWSGLGEGRKRRSGDDVRRSDVSRRMKRRQERGQPSSQNLPAPARLPSAHTHPSRSSSSTTTSPPCLLVPSSTPSRVSTHLALIVPLYTHLYPLQTLSAMEGPTTTDKTSFLHPPRRSLQREIQHPHAHRQSHRRVRVSLHRSRRPASKIVLRPRKYNSSKPPTFPSLLCKSRLAQLNNTRKK